MTSLIRLAITSTLTLLMLSITIGHQTVFDHIYGVISPATIGAQSAVERFVGDTYNSAEDYARKLFDNSRPRLKDQVQSRFSAPVRKNDVPPAERIMDEERETLQDLIKSHR